MATIRTLTLQEAVQAVRAYNEGTYGRLKNTELDRKALEIFVNGLGATNDSIEEQVAFVGRDYGGAAGFKAAYALIPDIARDITLDRERFERIIRDAPNVIDGSIGRPELAILYAPFVKPLHGKRNWLVWATKFWHFLNSNAFPVEDSRVDKFFGITQANSVDKYIELLRRYRQFVQGHQEWLPTLQEIDAGFSWSDTKLWDKVFFGLHEPALRRTAS